MNHIQNYIGKIPLIVILILLTGCRGSIQQPEEYYCQLFAGEPGQTSIILQARLQRTDTLVNNDLPGIKGFIKFRITRDTKIQSFLESNFFQTSDSTDYIVKYEFTGLRPGQQYFYRICYGRDTSNFTSSPWNSFKTLELPDAISSFSFAVISGLNFNFQYPGSAGNAALQKTTSEKTPVNSVFRAISSLKPDLLIGMDDYENYLSENYEGLDQNGLREKWHRVFSIPEFTRMLSHIPASWMADGNNLNFYNKDLLSSNDSGKSSISDKETISRVFYSELPLPEEIAENNQSYRTCRLNKDVQIWMLEESLFPAQCSKNNLYGKDLSGAFQLNWLKKTLKESDAAFKILISSFPFVGPVSDHSDFREYKTDRDSLFNWLKNNGFRHNGLYFICGDTYKQYHSIDPMGFEEFSCGTLIEMDGTSVNSINDSINTETESQVVQHYIQNDNKAGFLLVNSERDEYNSPVLLFRFFDDQKRLLYAVNKY